MFGIGLIEDDEEKRAGFVEDFEEIEESEDINRHFPRQFQKLVFI